MEIVGLWDKNFSRTHKQLDRVSAANVFYEWRPEVIQAKLLRATELLARGVDIKRICRLLEINELLLRRWQAEYGGSDQRLCQKSELENFACE